MTGCSAAIPFDEQAERSVLGSVLIDPDVIGDLSILEPGDFYRAKHRTIFTAIRRLGNRESPVDIVLVVDELGRMDQLEGVTEAFVSSLADNVPLSSHARHYAKIVKEHSVRREILLTSSAAAELGSNVEKILETLVSISPIEGEVNRIESEPWNPLPISELGPSERPDWVWDGYIAKGYVTLLTGMWKAGKSTLISHLFREMERGGELGTFVFSGRVLVVSEEPDGKWAERRDVLVLGDHIEVLTRPFSGSSGQRSWFRAIRKIASLVEERSYSLVVFDSLPNLWPVEKEEHAGSVLAAVRPLHAIADAGAAVLLTNHPAKSETTIGKGSRGSGALPAWVDYIIEFKAYDPERVTDTKRTLYCRSRSDESPPELVIELIDGRYVPVGTRGDVKRIDRRTPLVALIPSTPPGATAQELQDGWESEEIPKPSLPTLKRDLASLLQEGRLAKTGKGVRGDPERFHSIQLGVYAEE